MSDTVNEFQRICDAYKLMAAEGRYRPAAPGDGMGTIFLDEEELADPKRLDDEAEKYAANFVKEEDSGKFSIGVSNFQTNRALVFVVEAARLLCGGSADDVALRLLKMATAEVKASRKVNA